MATTATSVTTEKDLTTLYLKAKDQGDLIRWLIEGNQQKTADPMTSQLSSLSEALVEDYKRKYKELEALNSATGLIDPLTLLPPPTTPSFTPSSPPGGSASTPRSFDQFNIGVSPPKTTFHDLSDKKKFYNRRMSCLWCKKDVSAKEKFALCTECSMQYRNSLQSRGMTKAQREFRRMRQLAEKRPPDQSSQPTKPA